MPSKRIFIRILIIASLLLVNLRWEIVTATPVDSETQSTILFVKPGADGDCLSWNTACELQTALFTATDGDQIWMASGTYKPTTSSNREATFQLKNGVAIYGGFPGDGGGWEERNWDVYLTTLSGDIGVEGVNEDNSYTVVDGNEVDATSTLDGFIISGGFGGYGGGGLHNVNSSPTLSNIIIQNNSARYGAGMYNYNNMPSLTNVTFLENSAEIGGGMYNTINSIPIMTDVVFLSNSASGSGGGMYSTDYSKAILTNVDFIENTAGYSGGAMVNSRSSPTLLNVSFVNNSSISGGGAVFNSRSSPTFKDVIFLGNLTNGKGGGIYNYNQSNPSLTNITFSGNSADFGGGVYNNDFSNPTLTNVTFSGNSANQIGGGINNDGWCDALLTNVTFSNNHATNFGGGMSNYASNPTLLNVTFYENSATAGGGIYNNNYGSPRLTNTIVWGNTPDQIYSIENSSPIIEYSDIQGGFVGDGNIEADPLLGGLEDNGGFTLTHALSPSSPAIDVGNSEVCPIVDQRAYSRPIDGDNDGVAICDMGAYEYNSFPAIFTLTLDVVGSGSVVANPEKTDYYYGDVVTLTAIADSDWVFNGWVGDVTSMENPLTITIYDDTSITANFMFNAWVLTVSVNPEGAGTVSLNPDTPTYPYMSYVSASAIPNPGWTFAGWSGDASGTTNPTSVTMTSHKSITANFTQNEYSLNVTVNPEGIGSVAISPSKPNYHYGDIVTLTATPAIGWKFTSWSGDVTSTNNPLVLTITGNTSITANFTDTFYIYLPLILKN